MSIRSVFVGSAGIRSGWRFVFFVLAGNLLAEGMLWCVGQIWPSTASSGWSAWGIAIDEAFSLLSALLVAWALSRIEKRSLDDYGLSLSRGWGVNFAVGVVWGLAGSVLMVVVLLISGAAIFHGLALHGTELFSSALTWWIAAMMIGLFEEFLFRGYTLSTLATGIGFWPSAIFLSAIFGAVHYFLKPMESWRDGLSVTLYGLFWCLTLRRTGSLWFGIGFHAMSDYADLALFSQPNSGNKGLPIPGHLLDMTYKGPDWLTGGPCGTEASLIVFPILLAYFVLFDRFYPQVRFPLNKAGPPTNVIEAPA